MNKLFFRFLVLLMSLSLIGIILVQVYWFNTSFKNNDDQFGYHVTQVIDNVADKIEKQEAYNFYAKYNSYKDSTGKLPKKEDLSEIYYVQKDLKTNKTIVYSNSIISEDYDITADLFNKKFSSERFKSLSAKRVTEVYNNNNIDKPGVQQNLVPNEITKKSGNLDVLDNAQFEIFFKDIASAMPLEERVSMETVQRLIKKELEVIL